MNWEYISGFLDANGSVLYSKRIKGGNRFAQVSFSNNELSILKDIQKFILNETGAKGGIATKKARKETHKTSYDLKYSYSSAIGVLKRVNLRHPKKRHRKNILLRIQKLIPRNGKYKSFQLKKIEELYSQWK